MSMEADPSIGRPSQKMLQPCGPPPPREGEEMQIVSERVQDK